MEENQNKVVPEESRASRHNRSQNVDKRKNKHFNQTQGKSPKRGKSKAFAMISDFLFAVFIIGLLGSAVMFASMSDPDKSIFGYHIFGVLTNSMTPQKGQNLEGGFHAGDLIVVKSVKGEDVQKGDIITYKTSLKTEAGKKPTLVTHRLIKKEKDKNGAFVFTTRGDANSANDMSIIEDQIVGKKVFSIPKVGIFINFIKKNLIISIIFIVTLVCFLGVVKYYFSEL